MKSAAKEVNQEMKNQNSPENYEVSTNYFRNLEDFDKLSDMYKLLMVQEQFHHMVMPLDLICFNEILSMSQCCTQ